MADNRIKLKQIGPGTPSMLVTTDSNGNLVTSLPIPPPPSSGGYPQYHIASTDVINVGPNNQYFIYGNLTIDAGGILNNFGQVVIVNGALINNGTFNNTGALILVTLSVGSNEKFKANFTATAMVPFTINHNLGTLDFVYNVRSGNDEVDVQLTRIDTNNVQIVTTANVSGTITIIGD